MVWVMVQRTWFLLFATDLSDFRCSSWLLPLFTQLFSFLIAFWLEPFLPPKKIASGLLSLVLRQNVCNLQLADGLAGQGKLMSFF